LVFTLVVFVACSSPPHSAPAVKSPPAKPAAVQTPFYSCLSYLGDVSTTPVFTCIESYNCQALHQGIVAAPRIRESTECVATSTVWCFKQQYSRLGDYTSGSRVNPAYDVCAPTAEECARQHAIALASEIAAAACTVHSDGP
jgi:hypothetical protein